MDPSIGATDVDPVAIAWSAMWLLRLPVADPLLRHSGGGALNALLDLSALAGTALIGGLALAGSLSGPLPEKQIPAAGLTLGTEFFWCHRDLVSDSI